MKKKLINFSLVIFSFGFALLLAELLVRLFWPQNLVYHNESVWRPDDKLGWRHHERVNELVSFGRTEVTFRTDKEGFRINAKDKSLANDSSINVLVLGDSFMEAVQVESRKTVPQLLQEQLNQLKGLSTQFHNAGVSGWDPNQYYVEGRRVLDEGKLGIDHVLVFLYEGNDVIGREMEVFVKSDRHNTKPLRMPKDLTKRELTNSLLYPLNGFLEKNSHLFLLLRTRNTKLMTKLGLSSAYFPFVFHKKYQSLKAWKVTARVCKKIEQLFATKGIPVNFVLIPTSYQVNNQLWEEYLEVFDVNKDSVDIEQPNRILTELFAKDTMNLSDPLLFFRQREQNGERLYGDIDIHFIEAGHQAMTEFLMPMLSKELSNKKKSEGLSSN